MPDVELSTLGSVIKTAYEGEIGLNTQTGTTYTLALSDAWEFVEMNNAGAMTLTVPANASVAFPIGSTITVVRLGAGALTIQGATGVTLSGNGGSASAGSTTVATRYGAATLVKRATDDWLVFGDIAAVA